MMKNRLHILKTLALVAMALSSTNNAASELKRPELSIAERPKAAFALTYFRMKYITSLDERELALNRDALEDIVLSYRRKNDIQSFKELVQLRSAYLGESIGEQLSCVIESKGNAIRPILNAALKQNKMSCQSYFDAMLPTEAKPLSTGAQSEEVETCLSMDLYRSIVREHLENIAKKKPCTN